MTDAKHERTAQEIHVAKEEGFSRFQKALYTLMLVLFIGVGVTLLIWIFEPNPYTDDGYKRNLLTKQVYPGDNIRLEVDVNWTKTCYSRLRRNIIYSNGVLLPYEREIRLNKAGRRRFIIEQEIPIDAPAGPAKWVVITDWFCNPLQYFWPRTVDLEPLEFVILPPKGTSNEGKLPEVPQASSCLGRRVCKPS
jgi:hypothetical protein